jgi:hypothetical protein
MGGYLLGLGPFARRVRDVGHHLDFRPHRIEERLGENAQRQAFGYR